MPDESKLRIVIDTNLLVSAAIVPQSPPDKLVKSWLKKSFILLISYDQLEEIQEVSQRKKLKKRPLFTRRIAELIENIEFLAETVDPIAEENLPLHGRDPGDDFLLACALGGNADYLITGDKDLLVLNRGSALGKLKIVAVKDILDIL